MNTFEIIKEIFELAYYVVGILVFPTLLIRAWRFFSTKKEKYETTVNNFLTITYDIEYEQLKNQMGQVINQIIPPSLTLEDYLEDSSKLDSTTLSTCKAAAKPYEKELSALFNEMNVFSKSMLKTNNKNFSLFQDKYTEIFNLLIYKFHEANPIQKKPIDNLIRNISSYRLNQQTKNIQKGKQK